MMMAQRAMKETKVERTTGVYSSKILRMIIKRIPETKTRITQRIKIPRETLMMETKVPMKIQQQEDQDNKSGRSVQLSPSK